MKIKIFLKKITNTFLTPRIHNFFIKNKQYKTVLDARYKENLLERIFYKIFYFFPRLKETSTWAKGNKGKYRDFNLFEDLREYIDEYTLNKIYDLTPNKNSRVLDLGCNQGRCIRYLYKKGLRNLYGVDVMKTALDFFKENYKEIYINSNLQHNFFQRYLNDTNNNFFYNTYTFGATIEIVHPSYDIIREMVRVTEKNIILLIDPDGHWYPRFYNFEFKKNGASLIFQKKFKNNLTLLIYQKSNSL